MKRALLVLGHGSRSEEAVDVFNRMVVLIRQRSGFDIVEGAYMELARPTIEAAVEKLVKLNVSHIILAPYFLYEGMHIKRDIPEIVERLSSRHNTIKFKVAKPIGFEPVLADIIIRRAEEV